MCEVKKILIYDNNCKYCTITSSLIKQSDDIKVIPWDNDVTQKFLKAQFDEPPFAMAVVDIENKKILLGEDATASIPENDMIRRLGRPIKNNYRKIADTIGVISGRNKSVDKYEGRYNLNDEATSYIEDLLRESKQISD